MDDILDYISIVITLICPLLLGPGILLCLTPFHLCKNAESPWDRPAPTFLVGIICSFVSTYILHMVVSEMFVEDSFMILVVKNTFGFLFLIIVPLLILATHDDIRKGVGRVFASSAMFATGTNISEENLVPRNV